MQQTTKIFISYSWSKPSHEEWVVGLAQRLMQDGVDVAIDKWDLKEGHDKFHFMESMVKSEEIKKVLVILDRKYAEKADQRAGGVGTETQIISPAIYENVSQEKFIPIVTEKDDEGKPYLPAFLAGRIFIDFSDEGEFEDKYEVLIRNILEKPAHSKPKLGKIPSYLLEDSAPTFRTTSILRSFEGQVTKNPKRINPLLGDFLDEFFNNLKECKAVASGNDIMAAGKAIQDAIHAYTPLRNDLIAFIEKLLKTGEDFDMDLIIHFLEKLPALKYPQDQRSSWSTAEFEHYKFCAQEIFIYLVAIGIKLEKYSFIEQLLYTPYFISDRYHYTTEPKTFNEFFQHTEVLDDYYRRALSQNFASPAAHIMIQRIPENYTKDHLIDADLLIYYVSVLKAIRWFPRTYIYREDFKFSLFDRMISARHFEKVKLLFEVSTADEFKAKLNEIKNKSQNSSGMGYGGPYQRLRPIYELIDPDKIASIR